ncbi:MAG TPA: hypothetical protein GX513_10835 [Firmicutes bacterium]|nr:hypothetical protein [Bacillota bacterium]
MRLDEWPKGMELPEPEAPVTRSPVPLTLADGNYAGAIRLTLETTLPVEVRIDRCIVVERAGCPPQVRLALTVLGEKEDVHER